MIRNSDIELNYLRERNEVLLGRIEEYMLDMRDMNRKIRELEIKLSRANHPSQPQEND